MSYSRKISQPIFNRALNVLVKGVSSNFRFLGENETPIIARGKGAHIWDADGNEFIDYRLGWGPIILGHADERVNQAVAEHLENGTTFAATTELEVIVAEKLVNMIPGMEKLRFTNTGTEATMHALRTARGYTNKEKFIKFEGQYHGAHDYVLFSTASSPISAMGARTSPIPVQVGSGIPDKIRDYVYCLPFNDFDAVEQCVKDHHGDVAAMFVEPCLGNIAGIEPEDGYLAHLKTLCNEYNIVLVFDEVKTGFRLANGGAREAYGVIPDISTYAKSLGNGFPVAAFGGREEVMDVIGGGSVTHAGTFGANGVSMAAANAVLDILSKSPVLENLAERGKRLKAGLDQVLTDADVPHQMSGHPNIQGFLITEKPVKEVRDLAYSDDEVYESIMNNMYDRGVWAENDPREPWFLCAAHSDEIIDETLNKFQDSVQAAIHS
ncbi:MAG: guanitoxin biosynthesis PLP-dependent transaminase GntE [Candidatus Neomarinimicrobiota bacterium]|nr:guanitoxin biosynthesis PLP-dependent transaminase GntE [Candidatus Neomarinimicrobiota bacterium]MEE3188555.1 guanitoxin biosynthesis PLP-dependent transaminase GntE [Candidatus Neomarinimicrobiota bacterium]|tara:strand:+ start:1362 stop:2675 length:1314 start_codon:yes stop_codon:yes gene_type:complete